MQSPPGTTLAPGTFVLSSDGRGTFFQIGKPREFDGSHTQGRITIEEWRLDEAGKLAGARVRFAVKRHAAAEELVGLLCYRATPLPDGLNRAPVVDAGPPQLLANALRTHVSASFSDDLLPFARGVSRQWSLVKGPGDALFETPRARQTQVRFSRAGAYVLRFTAEDGERGASDDVTVVVGSHAAQSYHGLIRGEVGVIGSFDATINGFGTLTLVLRVGSQPPRSFTDRLRNGEWDYAFPVAGGGSTLLLLKQSADQAAITGEIVLDDGSVLTNGSVLTMSGAHSAAAFLRQTKQSSPFAGRYTWAGTLADGAPVGPVGFASGSLVVSKFGRIQCTGVLGDATPISRGGEVAAGDDSFVLLHWTKDGRAFGGELRFAKSPTGTIAFGGTVPWSRFTKDWYGFATSVAVIGMPYIPPQRGRNMLTMTEDELGLQVRFLDVENKIPGSYRLSLNARNQVSASDPSVVLRFDASTGLFSGTWREANKPAHRLRGAWLQPVQRAYGCYLDAGASNAVEIAPVK